MLFIRPFQGTLSCFLSFCLLYSLCHFFFLSVFCILLWSVWDLLDAFSVSTKYLYQVYQIFFKHVAKIDQKIRYTSLTNSLTCNCLNDFRRFQASLDTIFFVTTFITIITFINFIIQMYFYTILILLSINFYDDD